MYNQLKINLLLEINSTNQKALLMILDNENKNPKVYEWIQENTKCGNLDIVTGYFTIGAITYLSSKLKQEIKQFHTILGAATQKMNER